MCGFEGYVCVDLLCDAKCVMLYRPEIVKKFPSPLSSDALTNFGRLDMELHNQDVIDCTNYLENVFSHTTYTHHIRHTTHSPTHSFKKDVLRAFMIDISQKYPTESDWAFTQAFISKFIIYAHLRVCMSECMFCFLSCMTVLLSKGINIRLLGKLRNLTENSYIRKFIMSEMVHSHDILCACMDNVVLLTTL